MGQRVTTIEALTQLTKSPLWSGLLLFSAFSCAHAGGVVRVADEFHLRVAMKDGGTVTFAVDGTIRLAQTLVVPKDTVFDSTGRNVVLSGNDAVRVLKVPAGISLTLSNLTIAHGRHTGADSTNGIGKPGLGGGVWVAGTLHASGCRFWTNTAQGGSCAIFNGPFPFGTGGEGNGGAICVAGGSLSVSNSEFVGNSVMGGKGGVLSGKGLGGAVYQNGGSVHLNNCVLRENASHGGIGPRLGEGLGSGQSGDGIGGAFCSVSSSDVISGCTFEGNFCGSPPPEGGLSGAGGNAQGGALSLTGGKVSLTGASFISNSVAAGGAVRYDAQGIGQGGAIYADGVLTATNCRFQGNAALGAYGGGMGQDSMGGALYNAGSALLMSCQFSTNHVMGGIAWQGGISAIGPGGRSKGGGVYNKNTLVLLASTFDGNLAQGVAAGHGGLAGFAYPGSEALGGGIFSEGTLYATNNTFANNQAIGGNGVIQLGGANGFGGALFNLGAAELAFCTFSLNSALGGQGPTNGMGFGSALCSSNATTILDSCLIAGDTSGNNNFGLLTDAGHNLSSDASCNFTSATSLNSVDPKLGPLGDYGGPTLTCALWPSSPAIEAGNNATAPITDQRGVTRPQGITVDIGAFESGPPVIQTQPILAIASAGDALTMSFTAEAHRSYFLLSSSDFANWSPIATKSLAEAGTLQFVVTRSNSAAEFFRIVTP